MNFLLDLAQEKKKNDDNDYILVHGGTERTEKETREREKERIREKKERMKEGRRESEKLSRSLFLDS